MTNFILSSAIETLFQNYNIADILIIVFLVAIGAKEIYSVIDYFRNKSNNKFKKDNSIEKQKEEIDQIVERQKEQKNQIGDLKQSIEILINSDKHDIKSWIIEKHRELIKKGWVDSYDLDIIERRFKDYVAEGGNSYVEDLITDIRNLPRVNPIDKE